MRGEGLFGKWCVATPDMASYAVRIATATVKGKAETILATPQGLTLYYFTPDSTTKTACTGGCPKGWAPLLFPRLRTPPGAASPSCPLRPLTNPHCHHGLYLMPFPSLSSS